MRITLVLTSLLLVLLAGCGGDGDDGGGYSVDPRPYDLDDAHRNLPRGPDSAGARGAGTEVIAGPAGDDA